MGFMKQIVYFWEVFWCICVFFGQDRCRYTRHGFLLASQLDEKMRFFSFSSQKKNVELFGRGFCLLFGLILSFFSKKNSIKFVKKV